MYEYKADTMRFWDNKNIFKDTLLPRRIPRLTCTIVVSCYWRSMIEYIHRTQGQLAIPVTPIVVKRAMNMYIRVKQLKEYIYDRCDIQAQEHKAL